mgnify:CR=1 FL=1
MTEIREKVQLALEKHRLVRIDYRDRKGTETTRAILPLQWSGPNEIAAHCYLRDALRHFNINRVRAAQMAENPPNPTHRDVLRSESASEGLEMLTRVLGDLDPTKSYASAEFRSSVAQATETTVDAQSVDPDLEAVDLVSPDRLPSKSSGGMQ